MQREGEIQKGSYLYPDMIQSGVNHTAVAISAMKNTVPFPVKIRLEERGEWSDVVKWAQVAAVEAMNDGYDLKQTFNASQRYTYRAMRNAGYCRQRKVSNWLKLDTTFDMRNSDAVSSDTYFSEDSDDDEEYRVLTNVLEHIFKDQSDASRDASLIALTLKGWTDSSIAKELGIGRTTVVNRRRVLRKIINLYLGESQ